MQFTSATPKTIINSKEAGSAKVPPVRILTVSLPKKGAKAVKGTTFLTTKCTVNGGRTASGIIIGAGANTIEAPIYRGAAVYGADGGDAATDAKRANVSIDLSTLPRDAERALRIIADDFTAEIEKPEIKSLWRASKFMPVPVCTTPIKDVYSHRCPDADKCGQPRDVKTVSLTVWFTKFAEGFGTLAGKARTSVYAWESRTVNAAGVEMFDERTDDAGKTINAENCGTILQSGDIIRRLEIAVDGASVYADGYSLRMSVYKIWTERRQGDVASYILDASEVQAPAAATAPASAPAAAPVSAPVIAAAGASETAKPAEAEADDDADGGYTDDTVDKDEK